MLKAYLSTMFVAERKSLQDVFKMPMPTMRQTLVMAALYVLQAVVCVVLLKFLFGYFKWPDVLWAIISTILALQPGWSQSVATSVVRILATLVGAGVALLVSQVHLQPEIELIVSLVVVVFVCELMHLDLALRTACVAVAIVLTHSEGHLLSTATARCFATIAGCLMALIVQLITDLLRGRRREIVTVKS